MNHIRFMKKALELAESGTLNVSPNPAVGAVIVKNDIIIGEGFHRGPGTLHAEIAAIESAKGSVKGSTLYTTLEPCCSVYPGKRQPPCTERIIDEGIKAVVIAVKDPNQHVSGRGIEQLEAAGIKVSSEVLHEEALKQNKVYFKNISTSLPYVHLKIAQTIDGKIATNTGHSKWITDDDARDNVQKLRSHYDAVLIGSNTTRLDNPSLTVRNGSRKSIHRIVLNTALNIPDTLKLLEDQTDNPTTICVSENAEIDEKVKKSFLDKGVSILETRCTPEGRIDLTILLKDLFARGIYSVLVEGGSSVFTSFIKESLFDEMTFYIAPRICGSGISSIGDLNTINMTDSLELKRPEFHTINGQIILNGHRL